MEGIPVKNKQGCGILFLSEITYIECTYRRADIHTLEKVVSVYLSPREIRCYLDDRFHCSLDTVMVNFQQVKYMTRGTIFFFNGDELILGYKNYVKTRKYYEKYIKNLEKSLAITEVL